MKPKCPHQWQFVSKAPHGEDRVIYTYKCTLCPKTRTRNLKKPRFVPYGASLPSKGTKSQKPTKASQNGLKRKSVAIRQVSDKRKNWLKQYEAKKKGELSLVPVYGVMEFKGLLPPSMTERHHPLGRIGCRILCYRHVTPAFHKWIHDNALEARRLGYILPEMSGRQSGPDQPDPFGILPEYHAYLKEHGLH